MFIIDPILLLAVLAALLLPALFWLVVEEMGTRKPDHRWWRFWSSYSWAYGWV